MTDGTRRTAGRPLRSILLSVVLALCGGCTRAHDSAGAPRLVVVAIDGLEWRLALELMHAGRMPAIRAIAENGTAARLSTLEPTISPPIWTTIATGVVPSRHGIVGFVEPGAGGRPRLLTSRDRRTKALWSIAADAGLRPCVVGYWMTYPAERIAGTVVAQTGAPPGTTASRTRKGGLEPGRAGQVHPPELEARMFEIARGAGASVADRERDLYGDTSAWPPAMARIAVHSRWSLAADTAYEAIALDLVREPGRCGVVIVYLGLADVLGHRFWRWTYPGDFDDPVPPAEIALFGDVLRRAYVAIDSFTGEMTRAAGPGATIVVASDHGMGAWHPSSGVDLAADDHSPLVRTGGHSAARDAFFAASGPAVRRSGAALPERAGDVPNAGSVVDLAPTLLAMLGIARGSDMDGRVMTTLLDDGFVSAHPLREVPTHTPDNWAASRTFAADGGDVDAAGSEDDAQRIDQLRGLGYLE